MALQAVLDQWNNVMPEKITKAELLNPKEYFLINCIKNIFYKINKKVPENLDNQDEEIQRKSKLKLCNSVNKLYKLSDKSYSFFYLDLIEPSKKKTLHLLQNLLNYVLYYDMVKEEVVKKCEVSVKLLESLRTGKVNFETHIEELKIKQENQFQEEDKLKSGINLLDSENISEKAKLRQIDQDWLKWQENSKQLEKDCMTTDMEIKRMCDGVISAPQIENLSKEIASVQKDREELDTVLATVKINNETIHKENEQIRSRLTSYETLFSEIKNRETSINPNLNGIKKSDEEISGLKEELVRLKADLQSKKASEKAFKEKTATVKDIIEKFLWEYVKEMRCNQRNLITLNAEIKEMENYMESLEDELDQMQIETFQAESMHKEIFNLIN